MTFKYGREWRYFGVFSLVLLVGLGPVAAMNWFVNPFEQFGSPGSKHFDIYRSQVETRRYKSSMARKNLWDVLIVGNSVAEMAVDPADAVFGDIRAFNAGLSGASMYETKRMVDVALESKKPPQQIVHITMIDQWNSKYMGRHDFDKSLLNPNYRKTEYVLEGLLSLNALVSSYEDFWEGYVEADLSNYTWQGLRTYLTSKESEGYRYLFEKRSQDELKASETDAPHPTRAEIFRQMVERCAQEGVKLDVCVAPTHAVGLKILELRDELDNHEEIRRIIARTLDDVTREYDLPSDQLQAWDFTVFDDELLEVIPSRKNPDDPMNFFFEQDHIKPMLGRLMMERVLGRSDEFGEPLNTGTVEINIASTRMLISEFEEDFPEEVEWLEEIHDDYTD